MVTEKLHRAFNFTALHKAFSVSKTNKQTKTNKKQQKMVTKKIPQNIQHPDAVIIMTIFLSFAKHVTSQRNIMTDK